MEKLYFVSNLNIALSFFKLLTIANFLLDMVDAGSNMCVGKSHTCFINKSKQLYCWGSNRFYQISGPDSEQKTGNKPGEIESLKPISTSANEVTCGMDHTCFAKANGVYCFGFNVFGALGLDNHELAMPYNEYSSKVNLPASKIYHVSTFLKITCASTVDSVYCWGFESQEFYYGKSPVNLIDKLASAPTQLSIGATHGCYLLSNGEAYCWGFNNHGQLGISSTSSFQKIPTKVDISQPLSAISAGLDHTCVVYSESAKIACFGYNEFYQLGDGTNKNREWASSEMSSLLTNSLLGSGMVYSGYALTCVVSSGDSGVYCVGSNDFNSICVKSKDHVIGYSKNDYPPSNKYPIPLNGSISLAIGVGDHQCATDGIDVYCWGKNSDGQLGIGNDIHINSCSSAECFNKVCFEGNCHVHICEDKNDIEINNDDGDTQMNNGNKNSDTNQVYFVPFIILFGFGFLSLFAGVFIQRNKRNNSDSRKCSFIPVALVIEANVYCSDCSPRKLITEQFERTKRKSSSALTSSSASNLSEPVQNL